MNLSFYATGDASKQWTETYIEFLNGIGFKAGKGRSCNAAHRMKQITPTVHVDNFTIEAKFKDILSFRCKSCARTAVNSAKLGS